MPQQTLLVGVDGLPDSRRAFEWAVQEARLRDLRLELLCALPVAISGEWAGAAWARSVGPCWAR